MDRCTGHCCEHFSLPWDYKELKRRAKSMPDDKQLNQVAEMVIPLGFIENPDQILHPDHKHHAYTCKNYDKEVRSCTAYETRPKMCSDYPYGNSCNYKTCTWDAGQAGTYPQHEYAAKMLDACDTRDLRYPIFLKQLDKLEAKLK